MQKRNRHKFPTIHNGVEWVVFLVVFLTMLPVPSGAQLVARNQSTRTAPPPVPINPKSMTRAQILTGASLSSLRQRSNEIRAGFGPKGATRPAPPMGNRPMARWVTATIPMTPRASWTDLSVEKNPDAAVSVSTDIVDASVYSDTKAPLLLRIRTSGYAVQQQRFMIQYASQPTPTHAPNRCDAWTKPAALIASGAISVHFATVNPPLPAHTTSGSRATVTMPVRLDSHELHESSTRAMIRHPEPAPHVREAVRTSSSFTDLLPQAISKPLQYPATIWMRVVPLDVASSCSQAPSNWISIYIPGTRSEATLALAKAREATIAKEHAQALASIKSHYKVTLLSYVSPKLFDDSALEIDPSHYIILSRDHFIEGKLWKAGTTIDAEWTSQLFQKHPGILGQYWDLFTGELNLLSEGYETAKNSVVDVVAGALAIIHIPCDPGCHTALKAGLEAVLTECGIPPKIPNIQELYSRGSGYLAQNIASVVVEQFSGVDIGQSDSVLGTVLEETARAEVKKNAFEAAKEGVDALTSSLVCIDPSKPDCAAVAENPYTWGAPAPYFRSRPGVVWLHIERTAPEVPGGERITAMTVTVGPYFNAKSTIDLVHIPAAGLNIPVVVEPVDPSSLKDPVYLAYEYLSVDDQHYLWECGPVYYKNAPQIDLHVATVHLTKSSLETHGVLTVADWIDKKIYSGSPWTEHPSATYFGQTIMTMPDGSVYY